MPTSPSSTHWPLTAFTAKWIQLPRTSYSLYLRAHKSKSMLIYIYIYTHIHTHIYIYIYIHTHRQREASKSIYHAWHFVCIYGEMIAITTHENFAAPARPQRQVHVTFYIYIYIYIHTHTQSDRPANPSTPHCPFPAVTAKWLQQPRTWT
jgi:hypothetical protein